MVHVIDQKRPDLGGNMRFGDINTWNPLLWKFLIDRYSISSVLDVGCGEGHSVSWFRRQGIIAHGIEGLLTNVQRAVTPIALHDLLEKPYVMPVDLVWSCEVAEHISENKIDMYLDTLCNGRVIAMTHAVPGQGGHHHVNCQPSEYWISKLNARNYWLAEENEIYRNISKKEEVFTYFSTSGMVFHRG